MEQEEETEEQEIVFEQDNEMEEAPLFEDYGDLQEPVLRSSTRETRSPVDSAEMTSYLRIERIIRSPQEKHLLFLSRLQKGY